jgi:hypothetical protein
MPETSIRIRPLAERLPKAIVEAIRAAAKIPGLAVHEIAQMTDPADVVLLAQVLRHALAAQSEQCQHIESARFDSTLCEACARFLQTLDVADTCEEFKQWQREIDAAWSVS